MDVGTITNVITKGVNDFGANIFRVQIVDPGHRVNDWNAEEYQQWFDEQLVHVQAAADTAQSLNAKIIIDIHHPVGGVKQPLIGPPKNRIFLEEWARQEFIKHWQQIATQFNGHEGVLGYDLVNEPHIRRYRKLAPLMIEVGKEIRKIDQTTRIIFSTRYGHIDSIRGYENYIDEIKALKRIWITVHLYWPMSVTHQGIPNSSCNIRWPIGGKLYPTAKVNKAKMRSQLERVREFQRKHRVRIYVGEFSCARWSGYPTSNNPYNWLKDALEIFERYNWRYTYHAFHEAGIWDLEFGNDPCPDPCQIHCSEERQETDRTLLIKSFFERNAQEN